MSFGVTPSDVSAYANGLFFRDAAVGPPVVTATQPSAAQCAEYIAEAALIVDATLRSLGVDPGTVTAGSDTYTICARLVLLDTAAGALAARDRGNVELAREYRRRYEREVERLEKARQRLGSKRNTSDGAPAMARGPQPPSQIGQLQATQGADFWRRSNGQL